MYNIWIEKKKKCISPLAKFVYHTNNFFFFYVKLKSLMRIHFILCIWLQSGGYTRITYYAISKIQIEINIKKISYTFCYDNKPSFSIPKAYTTYRIYIWANRNFTLRENLFSFFTTSLTYTHTHTNTDWVVYIVSLLYATNNHRVTYKPMLFCIHFILSNTAYLVTILGKCIGKCIYHKKMSKME